MLLQVILNIYLILTQYSAEHMGFSVIHFRVAVVRDNKSLRVCCRLITNHMNSQQSVILF